MFCPSATISRQAEPLILGLVLWHLGGALGIGRRSNAADAPGTHPAAPTPVAYCGDPGWGDGLSTAMSANGQQRRPSGFSAQLIHGKAKAMIRELIPSRARPDVRRRPFERAVARRGLVLSSRQIQTRSARRGGGGIPR